MTALSLSAIAILVFIVWVLKANGFWGGRNL